MSQEFNELRQFLKDIKMSQVSGMKTEIYNDDGEQIACTTSFENTEGMVKLIGRFNICIDLLEEIKELTDDPVIKEKIQDHVELFIG